ncbi:MAG: glycosyltransferase family 4 protein [Anaerolineae bacterium]
MRICLISGEFPPMQGGVGDFTWRLAEAMAAQGHQVMVLTSQQAAGAVCQGCSVRAEVPRWNWGFWRTARRLFEESRPDVVNIQYQTAAYGMHPAVNLFPWWLRRRRERPAVVVTFHDLLVPFLFRGAGPLRRRVNDFLAAQADGVIATNEEDFTQLTLRAPAVPRRLIPIGSNILLPASPDYSRDAWRARWGIQPHEFALAYFGFLNVTKGGEDLIGALELLVREGRPVKLIMVGGKVGSSDPTNLLYLNRVEQRIQQSRLDPYVVWTDYLPNEEVSATLWAADAVVLPYRDGVSTRRGTLMAALAHGRPIVTTIPRLPVHYFQDGENLLLVPPASPEEIARAVQRLMEDAGLRERLGKSALMLSERFTWPAIAEDTLQFYAELLSRQRGA